MTISSLVRLAASPLIVLSLVNPAAVGADAWPSLRGPEHTGLAREANPPIEWSETKNIVWKVEVGGTGNASPVVSGGRVYVLSAVNKEPGSAPPPPPATDGRPPRVTPTQVHQFVVSAHDLKSGELAWKTVVREEVPHESLHPTASQASASPVTDGKHVWAFFGSRGLYCLDAASGKVVWEADFGIQNTRNEFGEGSSPVVHGDRIVVNWDHEGESFIVALNKATGEEVWRNPRDERTSWSTPLVVRDGNRDVVVTSADNRVVAYDLASGEEIWHVGGLGPNVVPTPVADDDTVFVMSGYRDAYGMAISYRGARGDLTGTERVRWETDRGLSYVPSAVLVDGRLYFFQRFGGILSCLELSTGEACYDQRRVDLENIYASPVAADDRIYALSREGATVVFRAGREFEVLARNELDDIFNATPAIVGNMLVLRGDRYLYGIAAVR